MHFLQNSLHHFPMTQILLRQSSPLGKFLQLLIFTSLMMPLQVINTKFLQLIHNYMKLTYHSSMISLHIQHTHSYHVLSGKLLSCHMLELLETKLMIQAITQAPTEWKRYLSFTSSWGDSQVMTFTLIRKIQTYHVIFYKCKREINTNMKS